MSNAPVKNSRELPEDRPASMDETGRRLFLYPADVTGFFHGIRNRLHFFLIFVFLALPWIQINGHQAVLLDIPQRRFALFGVTFWAHDAPMLIFVFGSIFVSIALLTSILGRVWCGWACPETVFVEAVYRKIERWIEGNALNRRKLDAGAWSFEKVWKKSLKWTLFLIVTLILSHSFLAYFVGTDRLMEMIQLSPKENPTPFLIMAGTTALLLIAFGWFREQFCIIVCPYGRFQSVLMDQHSMAVLYDSKRGEPRKDKSVPVDKQGDCVNCYRCVQVCPTGVDIRRGVQLECIACTACIDACDEVMTRIKKPKGLIRYETENGMQKQSVQHVRPRTVFYSFILVGLLTGATLTLSLRSPITMTLLRAVDTPYQVVSAKDASSLVINHFKLSLSNHSFERADIQFSLPESLLEKGAEIVAARNPVSIEAGKDSKADFFVRFPKDLLKQGVAPGAVLLEAKSESEKVDLRVRKEVQFVGPF